MKNSEIAEAAAEYIEENGWGQGGYWLKDGRVCLLGALRQTHPQFEQYADLQYDDLPLEAYNFLDPDKILAEIVCPVLTDDHTISFPHNLLHSAGRVIYVNDHVLTEQEQALQVLADAAKYWRDRGE